MMNIQERERPSFFVALLPSRPFLGHGAMSDAPRSSHAASPMEEDALTPAEMGGTRTRKASPKASPRSLPKAPQGELVAQRLLRNATARPIQRFDSADYFLHLHHEQQRRQSSTVEQAPTAAAAAAPSEMATQFGRSRIDQLSMPMPPPPLARDAPTTSPRSVDDDVVVPSSSSPRAVSTVCV